ncbi:MAG: cysteine desulfurase family protein [Patescibacteria group bacterium]
MKKGKLNKRKRIYLDYAAATPIDEKVRQVMQKVETETWANPSSLHQEGERAKNILEEARTKIAAILRCRASEIYFTSGGTEAANIAVQGVMRRFNLRKKPPHIICSSIEHPAVLQAVKNSEAEISIVRPDASGIVNPQAIEKEIKPNTVLVCLMHSNNEIGTIQPIREVSKIKKQAYLLTDASQSALYEDVAPERLGADLLILDGIKICGPRGVGALFIKHGIKISPIIFGGGQERGLRSGTENTVAAAGLALALQIAVEKREEESARLTKLRDYATAKILKEIPYSSLNGDPQKRLPNNINICFTSQGASLVRNENPKEAPWGEPWGEIDSEFLVIKLDTLGFAVSAASACHNLNLENSSYVIEALDKNPSNFSGRAECASSSLRFTLGCATTKHDLNSLISALKKICRGV